MKSIAKDAATILDHLLEGVRVGERRVRPAPPGLLAIHTERVEERLVTLAHYVDRDGVAVPAPEVQFVKDTEGRYLPISYLVNDERTSMADRVPRMVGPGFDWISSNVSAQRDLAVYCTAWIRTLRL